MAIYILVDIFVIGIGTALANAKIKTIYKVRDGKTLFVMMAALLLIFISAFRGDFSADYNGYVDMFNRFQWISFDEIIKRGVFEYPEKGYLLFQYVINLIFHDPFYIFLVSSIIIVINNLYFYKRYTSEILLALMLFVEGGIYYPSFNLVRQFLAAGVLLLGSKFLFERKFLPYAIIVVLAFFVHASAVIMIPFYFFSSLKVGKKNMVLYIALFVIMVFALPYTVNYIQQYYWGWYFRGESSAVGYSWKNIVLPVFLSGTAFICYLLNKNTHYVNEYSEKNLEHVTKDEMIDNICLNASFLYLAFSLLGMRLRMMDRFVSFFTPYMVCFLCKQVHLNKHRSILILGIIFILVLFGLVTHSDLPYYFIWDK